MGESVEAAFASLNKATDFAAALRQPSLHSMPLAWLQTSIHFCPTFPHLYTTCLFLMQSVTRDIGGGGKGGGEGGSKGGVGTPIMLARKVLMASVEAKDRAVLPSWSEGGHVYNEQACFN